MLFSRSSFNFSNHARDWILNRYEDYFKNKFPHDLAIEQQAPNIQQEWLSNSAGKELVDFLSQYNCDISLTGIGLFVSNIDKHFIGNPHVDSRYDETGVPLRIKTRFNVLVLGNPEDVLVWWPDWEFEDTRFEIQDFETVHGFRYKGKSVPGMTPEQRWDFVGSPPIQEKNLLTPSAFLRTDYLHTVMVSPGPRLIVTVAIDKTIEDILGI